MGINPDRDDYDTPFRRWLAERAPAVDAHDPDGFAATFAPSNRFDGLTDDDFGLLAVLTGTTEQEVRAAHKEDIAAWIRENELREHPDLVVLDAELDRAARGGR